ncbi:uncharacterized protein LOC143018737 [Oratosquilla oratoria]|uniref:uncharacterized protein LOC143018737 n=1 Tax=Oratosquilla oratoria TaxID=337810 RepID=UPI003F766518
MSAAMRPLACEARTVPFTVDLDGSSEALIHFCSQRFGVIGDNHTDQSHRYFGPLVAVTVEKGATARLPCNFQPVHHNDQVQLILWYRNGTSRPFLSHDSRSDFEPPESGVASSSSSSSSSTSLSASSSSVLSPSNAYADSFNRLSASVGTEMEGRMSLGKGGRILILRQVTDKDGAEYRCKVHFRLSPTWTQRLLLRVSSSLTSVHLTGINGEAVGRRIGPYPEGASLGLICEANYTGILDGLRWTLDGKELDSTWQRKRDGVVINQLTIESLERRHLHADLTCQLRCRGPEGTGIKANITHASTTIDMFSAVLHHTSANQVEGLING